jgi:hypothetical protein
MADGTKTRGQVLQDLILLIRRGDPSVATEAQRVAYIQSQTHPDELAGTTPEQFYQQAVLPTLSRINVPTAAPVISSEPLSAGPGFGVGERDLLERQDEEAQYLRGIMGATSRPLGRFLPEARKALGSAFSRFGAQESLMQPTPDVIGGPVRERGARFQDFLTGPARTSSDLSGALASLIEAFRGGQPGAISDFMARFPTGTSALQAGIQPYLTNVAPRQRAAVSSNLMDLLEPQLAMDPQAYQDPAQIVGLFDQLAKQGLLPR